MAGGAKRGLVPYGCSASPFASSGIPLARLTAYLSWLFISPEIIRQILSNRSL